MLLGGIEKSMKTKQTKGFLSFFTSKAICMSMVLILSVFAPILCIYAQDAQTGKITENYNLINEYSNKLNSTVANYGEIDTSENKSVSISVAEVINLYRASLFELQSHPEVNDRLLTDEIKAAYSRAEAGGRLAWLYYYNIPSISSPDSIAKIDSKYSVFYAEISSGTDAAVIDARANVICTEFNRAIYTEKIKGLSLADDSIDSAALISGAVSSLEKTSSPDLFAENFSQIFSNLLTSLNLQRARDNLTMQLETIFKVVSPDGNFNSNEATTLFVYNVKNAQTVSQMNKSITDAIHQLTEAKIDGVYSNVYIQNINLSVSDAANRASSEELCVNILPIFKDYYFDYKKSKAKDEIQKILLGEGTDESEALKENEKKFNADGGSVDACESEAALEKEISCAKYQKLIFDEKIAASKKLAIFLSGYDWSSFESRLEKIRSDCSYKLWEKKAGNTNFETEGQSLLNNAKAELSNVLNEAKAERFLLDNKTILQKPKENIVLGDELSLRSAIVQYTKLESSVQSALKSQIERIAEKYNILLCKKARSLLPDDALYLDLCESICTDIKNTPANNIDVFYNTCDRIFKKSEILRDVVIYYRQILSGEIYQNYSDAEKQELLAVCHKASQNLGNVNSADSLDFEEAISQILNTSKLSIDRINECARVRIKARGSQSATIQALIAEAGAKIKVCDNKSEMISLADKMIFKIERELTKEAVSSSSDKLKLKINKMKFLTDSEKSSFLASIKNISSSALNDAGLAENITVLTFVWNTFEENLNEISSQADSEELLRAREHYTALFEDEIKKVSSKLNSMAHISSETREEFLNSCSLLSAPFKSDSALCLNSDSVADTYSKYLKNLNSLLLSADSQNTEIYKSIIKKKLEEFKSLKNNYSVENYKKLEEEILKAIQKLSTCQSIFDCDSLLESATSAIESISTLLDDAKSTARSKLDATIRACRANSQLYSQSNMLEIENLYNEAIKKIAAYASISDIPALTEHLSNTLILISAVRKDILFTSEEAAKITNPNPEYPLSYNFDKGYWGSISLTNGIDSSATFLITKAADYDAKSIQALIRKAARENSFKFGDNISAQTLKALKKCVVSLGIDISLSNLTDVSGNYTVKMLLPSSLSQENLVGVVFVGEDGSVEFYNVKKENSLISFDLSHFSEYYIVTERTTNLSPLITFLCVMLLIEFAILILVAIMHFNRKRKERNMPLLLSSLSFSPTLPNALRIIPQNGVAICLFLSIAVLALGCGVAFLAKIELDAIKSARAKSLSKNVEGSANVENSTKCEEKILLNSRQKTPVLCGASAINTEFLPSADEDFEFIANEDDQIEFDFQSEKVAVRKAEINLDVIAEAFEAGELVNLEALKKKRLVSKRTDYIKILARGTLTKPLVIEAHDFSHAAKEMLKSVGGEAIQVKL